MPTPLTTFRTMYLEYHRYRYPNIPDYGRTYPNYLSKLRTTNGMTNAIKGYLLLNGWMCERISNTGRQITKHIKRGQLDFRASTEQQYIPGSGTNGRADLSAKVPMSLEIEVKNKYTNDRMRPEQYQYKRLVEASGGVYVVATSFDDFVTWYEQQPYGRNPQYMRLWEVIRDSNTITI